MAAVWSVAFFILLYVVACLVLAIYLRGQLPPGADVHQTTDIMQQFMSVHAPAVSATFWALVLVALFAGILGSLKGLLPGTKPKPQA